MALQQGARNSILIKNFFAKALWPLFTDEVQLSQNCRATTKRKRNHYISRNDTYLNNVGRMKDWVDLQATYPFWTWDP